MSPFQGPFLSLSHSTSVNIRLNWGQEIAYCQFIKLVTHWKRVTQSPSTRVRNWGTPGSSYLKGSEAAREGRRDWLPWRGRRWRAPAEAGSEYPARAPTADPGTRALALTWPGERAASCECSGLAETGKRRRRPHFPDPAVVRQA